MERELPNYGKKNHGSSPSMRQSSTTHTLIAYDVSLLP